MADAGKADAVLQKGEPRTAEDAAALLCHAAMMRLGFVPADDSYDPLPDGAVLPEGWRRGGGTYAFRYRHPQSSFGFEVMILSIAGRCVLIAAADQGQEDVARAELRAATMAAPDGAPLPGAQQAATSVVGGVASRLVPSAADLPAGAAPAAAEARPRPPDGPDFYYPRPTPDPEPRRGPPPGTGDVDPMPLGGPLHGYGRGDLMGGGGNLAGPELFRPRGPGAPGGGGWVPGPDGPLPAPPPGARFDPFGPPSLMGVGGGPDPDLAPPVPGPGGMMPFTGKGGGKGGGGGGFGGMFM
eukprot:TRINITY_DN51699_c0_g1_i1.p2 TRINITY_DN51699_c0_g1~~TRINITY_DN51699_c0_g1_i1.p2  ORF type:complete len:334 (+),score=66.91 TRINITY_DN51699_c0_g1_i1:109-1002(+)